MSSDRKDARWQLAYDMLKLVDLDYQVAVAMKDATFDRTLVAAQVLLDANPAKVPELAARWRAES